EVPEQVLFVKIGAQLFQGVGIAEFERLIRKAKVFAVHLFGCHEQRIVFTDAAPDKGADLLAVKEKTGERLSERDIPLLVERAVVRRALMLRGEALLLGEKSLFRKHVKIDKIWIARRACDWTVRRI